MTDGNDLRRMLDELADETPEVPAKQWLTGTRHKVRVRRRARWAGATMAAALVLTAAIAVVPQVVDDTGTEPGPVEPAPEPPGDGRAGWHLPEGMGTSHLISARMNDPDTSEFQWSTANPSRTKRTERLVLFRPTVAQFCVLPDDVDPGEPTVRAVSSIDGRVVFRSRCRQRDAYPPLDTWMTWSPLGADLRRLGVDQGESFTVSMRLERDGQAVELRGVEFGFAVYWQCGADPRRGGEPGGSACGGIF